MHFFNKCSIYCADYTTSWNWSFKADLDNSLKLDSFIYADSVDIDYNPISCFENRVIGYSNHVFNVYYNNEMDIQDYYSNSETSNLSTQYPRIYRDTSTKDQHEFDYANYSQFTKALEYVIYSYALDLEPDQLTVNKLDSAPYYEIRMANYSSDVTGENRKTAVEKALEDRIELFERIGSFVGLVDRQITKITNWILNNVIGSNAMANDTFTRYDNVTEVVTIDNQNNETITYDLGTGAPENLGRNYTSTVQKLVRGVCNEVTIGTDSDSEDGQIHVDERFLASYIKEYAGNTFFISDDVNFSNTSEDPRLPYIQPLEYQSVTLMLKQDTYITDLWVALKYDADLNGTEDGFTDRYIDIIVDLNYYNHDSNTLQTVSSEVCRVYDGPYYFDFLGAQADENDYSTDGVPIGHQSGVMFETIGRSFTGPGVDGDAIFVKAFNPDIGDGALKTDVGEHDYKRPYYVSQNPKQLSGLTNLRKYYSLIESQENETGIDEGFSYITGKLNSQKFAGDDGCDYLELTYRVIKKNGDYSTSYKFYTGLALIWTAE